MDWIRENAAQAWLIAALALLGLELLSTDLILLMLAGGALVGMVVALVGGPFVLQLLAGLVVAVGLLALVRPGMVRRLHSGPTLKIGPEALIGTTGVVLETVRGTHPGRVKFGGEIWSAAPLHEADEFEVGADVQVTAIRGGVAVVVAGGSAAPDHDTKE